MKALFGKSRVMKVTTEASNQATLPIPEGFRLFFSFMDDEVWECPMPLGGEKLVVPRGFRFMGRHNDLL